MHCRGVDVTMWTARGPTCFSSPATAALLMHVGFTAKPAMRTRARSATAIHDISSIHKQRCGSNAHKENTAAMCTTELIADSVHAETMMVCKLTNKGRTVFDERKPYQKHPEAAGAEPAWGFQHPPACPCRQVSVLPPAQDSLPGCQAALPLPALARAEHRPSAELLLAPLAALVRLLLHWRQMSEVC